MSIALGDIWYIIAKAQKVFTKKLTYYYSYYEIKIRWCNRYVFGDQHKHSSTKQRLWQSEQSRTGNEILPQGLYRRGLGLT